MRVLLRIGFALISLLAVNYLWADVKSTGTPKIKNYAHSDIPAGSQSWMITYDHNGMVYFANNDGVLSFDGVNWRTHTLPDRTIVRSVLAVSDTIYAGGYNELGYFTKQTNGALQFTPLQELLSEENRDFDEVWKIHKTTYGIVFQSFDQIMIYNKGEFNCIKSKNSFHFSYLIDDRLFVNDQNEGLFELVHNKLVPLKGAESLAGKLIWSIVPFGDDLLIATSDDGLFLYQNGKISYWKTDASAMLKQKQVYCGLRIDDNHIAYGTIQDGLLICDNDGIIKQHVNIEAGLQNNTILSMNKDAVGNLWLGLDNGIDYVEINSPLSYFSYPSNLSAGYTGVLYDGMLYLGTNRGVFYHDWKSLQSGNKGQEFKLVRNSQGQVWELKVIDGTLFCGHNSGIFTIKDSVANIISDVQGAWSFIVPENQKDIIISGTYTNLVKLVKKAGNWTQDAVIGGFKESSRFIVNAGSQSLWMSHGYKGVFKIHLNKTFDSVTSVQYYNSNHGFPSDKHIRVVEVLGQTIFCTGHGYYKYDAAEDAFVLNEKINQIIKNPEANVLLEDGRKNIWYFTKDQAGVYRLQEDGNYVDVNLPFRELNGKIIWSFQFVLPVDEQHVFIGLQDGFAHYTPDFPKDYNQAYKALIRKVIVASNDSVIFWGNENLSAKDYRIPFTSNQLNFSVSALDYENPDKLLFSTWLENFEEDWTPWHSSPLRQFTNLRQGDYVFKVKAKNLFDTESDTTSFRFTILPPWYYSWWAYTLYFILFITMIYLGFVYVKHRLKQSKLRFAEEQQKQFQEREKRLQTETLKAEKEVISLRNEKLRQEMILKDKELANSTMQMIQKSKTLTNLKRDLQKLSKETRDDLVNSRVRAMVKKINRDIDSDKQWEVFESHFESVHEEFLKRLKQQYPELSPRELKLSAYLRLNISSKEIASLMNISVRGVEISRYRLRKKLQLEHDQNLTDFIMMF